MYGDALWDYNGRSILPTLDGNYLLTGSLNSQVGMLSDILVMKIEPDGDTIWTRAYGGASYDWGNNTCQAGSGYLVYGTTRSFGSGGSDFISLTIDGNGDTIRSSVYGGIQDDDCTEGQGAGVTAEGNYIFAGQTISYGAGYYDAYLIKTDYTGSVLWSRTYGGNYSENNGTVVQTRDSGFACAGYTTSFGVAGADIFIIKTDSIGNLQWSRCYGMSTDEIGYGLIQTMDGGYLITGLRLVTSTDYNVLAIKTDSLGNLMWTKEYGGTSYDWGYGAVEVSTGGYLIYGRTMSYGAGAEDALLIRTDFNGDTLWTRAYGQTANDHLSHAMETPDGGFLACGKGVPVATSNRNHLYLIKTDSNGNSGCNEMFAPMTVNSPILSQITPNTIQGTGCIRRSDTLQIQSGTDITNLCFTIGIEQNKT